jgi:hypothetical protein
MIKATFSNGFTDTYNGTRKVTAAWALINKESGEVIASGHSLTVKAAESTAKSSKHLPNFDMKWAKTWGIKDGTYVMADIKRMNQENKDFRISHRVEVVSL